jgi:asparagine synthase (glutamine-hydrolysing)
MTIPASSPRLEPVAAARTPVGGAAGLEAGDLALRRLARALGSEGRLLCVAANSPEASALVADADCCFIGEVPVTTADQWRLVLQRGRLSEVEGAVVLAWAAPDGSLSLARDAVGERTLYYAVAGGRLLFASTIRALLASALVPRSLNLRAVAAYLSYAYVPGRETLVEGVHELLPGEVVSFRDGCLRRDRFWEPPREDSPARPEDDYAAELRLLLERAVARRLPAAGPVAASLSGGVDSSLVVALARSLYGGPLVAYSLSFGPDFPNELAFSSLVANEYGIEQRILEITPQTVIETLDDALGALSKPIGDPLTVPNLVLFGEAAAEASVVLNGEGGDPCFGGPKNVPMLLAEIYGEAGRGGGEQRRERAYLRSHRKCYADLGAMLEADVVAALADDPLETALAGPLRDPRWSTLVARLMALNVAFKGAHHILPKIDQLGASFGVHPRSPLFDRAVVEAALRMPAHVRLRGTVEKHVLKRAVADVVPGEIIRRPKSGMRVPVEGWLAEGRYERFARERLLDGLAPYGLVRRSYLEALTRGDAAVYGRGRGMKTWLLLSLEAWLRTVFAARS